MVECIGLPCHNFGWDRDHFVRAAKCKAGNHRGVAGISIAKVEMVYDLVDKCSLGEGDSVRRAIMGEGDS